MQRFIPLYFSAALFTTQLHAQEQTLASTAIKARVETPVSTSYNALISNDVHLPPIPDVSSSYAVGATPANAAVSPSGAFTYEVPIAVPPGVQDVQPNIALSYNSQSGNGLAGWGWNISGLSTISRVGSTLHHDGTIDPVDFDALDRFALDGQRLILVSGTYGQPDAVYTTENYANIKITSVGTHPRGNRNGPRLFIVSYPDGSSAHYGYYKEEVIGDVEINDASSFEWVITKWTDTQRNSINYFYEFSGRAEQQVLRIAKIEYGSHEVIFHYKNRQRHDGSYVGGHFISRNNILSHIEAKSQGTHYRTYTLSHQTTSLDYEKVIQIQERGSDNTLRTPVVFSYDSSSTSSSITSSSLTSANPGIRHEKAELITGNLNNDANLDYVAYNKDRKDSLYIYTAAFTREEGVADIAHAVQVPRFDQLFTVAATNEDGGMDAFQRLVTIRETLEEDTARVQISVYGEMPDDRGDAITVDYTKEWQAPTHNNYICNDFYHDEKSPDEVPIVVDTYKIPKTYVSGDFDGDGLTEVLAIQKSYTRTSCRQPHHDCDDNRKRIQSPNGNEQAYVDGDCACDCDYYTVSGGSVYLLNLARDNANIASSAGNIPNYSSNDRLLTADFNGDGKTDLWHLEDGSLKIYSLINNSLTRVGELSNSEDIKINLPMLLGDYNGDGLTDFIIPKKQKNTNTWHINTATGFSFDKKTVILPFRYYRDTLEHKKEKKYFYLPQDINKDGKTDIVCHFITTNHGRSGEKNDRDDDDRVMYNWWSYNEEIKLFENDNVGTFVEKAEYKNSDRSIEVPSDDLIYQNPRPVFTGVNVHNKKTQYAVLSRNLIKRYDISTPHKRNMRLRAVTNHGVRTRIDYAGLDATDYGSVYEQDSGLSYPYVHINHAPGMELVSKLTQTANNHTRYQEFKYKGAVSHMRGLGFMGFTGLARSNLYGDNVAALWTVSKQDPRLRGATTEQWTDSSYSFDANCYISKTVTGYDTELKSNKVYVSVPKHMATHNSLTDVLHERFFTYDSYFNLASEREKTEGLDKTTTYEYFNNPTTTTGRYYIGRLKSERAVAKVPGATDFWTEKSYTYENHLLQTEKVRANDSNWLTTTYDYDTFGNLTSKALSGSDFTTRTELFTYYANGRDMHTHTDVLGLTKTYEYYPYGALKKEVDPYNNSTQYTYDGWNRLKTTTNYLGKETTVSYAHRSGGGVLKTVDHPNTAADTKTYYNALGWIDEVHTQVSSTQWSKVFYKYDAAGRTVEESVPSFSSASKWTKTYYDSYNRISSIYQANGKVIQTTYDGLRTQVSDGTKTASTTKNALDQIVELADPGGTIHYSFHANGELRQADYGGYVVKTELDKWGRKNKLIDPTAGTFTYKHNDLGELLEETAPKGKTVYQYDGYGRMTQKDWTGSLTNMATNYHYTSDTKLLDYVNTTDSQNSTTHRIDYEYDNYKRVNKLLEQGAYARFSKTMSYDSYGRVITEHYEAELEEDSDDYSVYAGYTYEVTGAVRTIKKGPSFNNAWEALQRNALGQVTQSKTGNGYTQTKTIDEFGFVSAVTDQKGTETSQKALDLSYTFDVARGLLTARSDNLLGVLNQQFTYDSMDRLTVAQADTNNLTQARTRGYDPRGRITQDSFIGTKLTYGSGDLRYRLTAAELNPVGKTYYDTHKDRKLTYNADRKPVEVHDVGNGRITFHYSHDGHRQEVWYGGEQEDKTDRRYHKTYSRIAPIELVRDTENDSQKFLTYIGGDAYSAPVVHVQDSNDDNPDGFHYLHRDYLGSILAVSNSDGEVIERAHFGAWGDVALFKQNEQDASLADSLTGRGFTGHEHFTEVGLVHMNGRMYDPMLGRFLSPDNNIQDPYNTQNFNRYGYVLNNPLTLTDPSGEFIATLFAIVKIISYVMTAIQALHSIVSGAPIVQVLAGVGIGLLAGALGGGLAEGIKGVFSAAGTAVGAFIRGAVSTFGGQLISGTLAGVVQGTSFRRALRANFGSAGIAAAAGGIAGASEFKAQQKADAIAAGKQRVENRKQLDAMAELANDNLSKTMTSPEQIADYLNAKYGTGEIQIGGLKPIENSNSLFDKLNPDNYQLSNSALRGEIKNLYGGLVEEVGHTNFEFRVTGGDRYIGADGKVYSSTNDSLIRNSSPTSAHIKSNGARAVDLRIQLNNKTMDYKIIQRAIKSYGGSLRYQKGFLPFNYSDGHHHLYIPK